VKTNKILVIFSTQKIQEIKRNKWKKGEKYAMMYASIYAVFPWILVTEADL